MDLTSSFTKAGREIPHQDAPKSNSIENLDTPVKGRQAAFCRRIQKLTQSVLTAKKDLLPNSEVSITKISVSRKKKRVPIASEEKNKKQIWPLSVHLRASVFSTRSTIFILLHKLMGSITLIIKVPNCIVTSNNWGSNSMQI